MDCSWKINLKQFSNGYQQKWGYVSSPTSTYNLTFPTAFSYSCYGLYFSGKSKDGNVKYPAVITKDGTLSKSGCSSVNLNSTGYSTVYWFAIGY